MKRFGQICVVGFVALTLLLISSPVTADNAVVVLTEDNFENEVGRDRGAFVEFYAPWYNNFSLRLCILFFLISLILA